MRDYGTVDSKAVELLSIKLLSAILDPAEETKTKTMNLAVNDSLGRKQGVPQAEISNPSPWLHCPYSEVSALRCVRRPLLRMLQALLCYDNIKWVC